MRRLTYDSETADKPYVCRCGDVFNVDHAMVCRRSGFIILRHNELRDLEADKLIMVCRSSRESRYQVELAELPTLA